MNALSLLERMTVAPEETRRDIEEVLRRGTRRRQHRDIHPAEVAGLMATIEHAARTVALIEQATLGNLDVCWEEDGWAWSTPLHDLDLGEEDNAPGG